MLVGLMRKESSKREMNEMLRRLKVDVAIDMRIGRTQMGEANIGQCPVLRDVCEYCQPEIESSDDFGISKV